MILGAGIAGCSVAYHLVTVMDDYSRFILAQRLQRDMTSNSSIKVVQEAVERTGMDQVADWQHAR